MSDQSAGGLLSPFLKAQRLNKVREYVRGRVLDFGCGTGDLGRFCTPNAYLGFDIDAQSLSIARAKYPNLSFTDHFPLLDGTDEKYDAIILPALIEHVDDPASLLKLLNKHLAPKGHIVITTPHPSFGWVHTLGAKVGIFSEEASKEHKMLLGKDYIHAIALEANLAVVVYQRFLFGANQLVVLVSQA